MNGSIEFASPSTVKIAIDRRVREHLGTRPTRDSALMYAKALGLVGAAGLSYWMLVFEAASWQGALGASVVLALALVGIGFNVQHDGNHGGFSTLPWVNRVAGFTLDLIGASSYFWKDKHNHSHHVYTNIPDEDADINLGPLARLSDDHHWLWFHRYQHVYLWVLYAFVHLRYLYSDLQRLFFGKRDGLSAGPPRGSDLAALVFGKAVFLGLAFGVPLTRHGFGTVLGVYVFVSMIMGVIFSIVFQLAHSVDIVEHPVASDGTKHAEWAVHQIRTTANFAPGNRFLTFALGGLNYQREHHLFPKVAHVHYPGIARVVREVCAEHHVDVCEAPSVIEALRSHYRFVRRMGVKPAALVATSA